MSLNTPAAKSRTVDALARTALPGSIILRPLRRLLGRTRHGKLVQIGRAHV